MLSYKQKSLYIKTILLFLIISLFSGLISIFVYNLFNRQRINGVMFHLVAESLLGMEVKPAVIRGIIKGNSRYYITSKGIQDYMESFFFNKNIIFDYPTIRVQLNDKTTLDIKSKKGEFDERKKIFNLYTNVQVKSSNGMNLKLDKVYFNLAGSVLYSNEPVTIYNEQIKTVASSFSTAKKLKVLDFKGPIKSYDIKNEQNRFETNHNVQVDTNLKTISTIFPFKVYFQNKVFMADNIRSHYITLTHILQNLRNKSLSNFHTIDMDNIVFLDKKTNGKLLGDKMMYRQQKHLAIIKSKGYTTYKSDKYDLSVKDRLEYHDTDRVVVARGRNIFKTYDLQTNKLLYNISADLVYFQLNEALNSFDYAEAFNNIKIVTDTVKVSSDYAYLDNKTSTLYMEENVKIIYDSDTVEACRVVMDLTNKNTQVIPCNDSKYLKSTIKVKKIDKNAKKHKTQ